MRFKKAEVEIVESPADVAERAAEETVTLAAACIKEAGRFSIALAGGTTPRPYHQLLATKHKDAIDWSKVIVFFADDRAVGPTHKDSNFRMAEETLLSRVPIPGGNIHRIEGEHGDHVRAAAEYEQTLVRVLGPSGIVDLVLLGMGEDGHTASLFPRSASGQKNGAPNSLVIPVEAPPTSPIMRRVSFSYAAIAKARVVLAMITGSSKAGRLQEVLVEEGELPMQRVLRERTGKTLVIVDTAAASIIAEASKN
jgi:6-phosphogluconolactonase